jgi:predicted RNA methylase
VSCAPCQGIAEQFDRRVAGRELRRFQRRGPTGTTRRLVDAIAARGVSGRSLLDIGGGVGAIQHHLTASGASSGTCVDASPAYLVPLDRVVGCHPDMPALIDASASRARHVYGHPASPPATP